MPESWVISTIELAAVTIAIASCQCPLRFDEVAAASITYSALGPHVFAASTGTQGIVTVLKPTSPSRTARGLIITTSVTVAPSEGASPMHTLVIAALRRPYEVKLDASILLPTHNHHEG